MNVGLWDWKMKYGGLERKKYGQVSWNKKICYLCRRKEIRQ